MKKFLVVGRWLALCGVICLVGLTMAYAAPARARGENTNSHETARVALAPHAVTDVTSLFGLDEGGVLRNDANARALAVSSGVHSARMMVSWNAIESTQGVYDFTATDETINTILASGLTPIIYIAHNPPWAANLPCGPIDTNDSAILTAFGNFMNALAAHYPDVKIWALYNEEDDPNGDPTATSSGCFGSPSDGGVNNNNIPDYAEYAIMLKTAWKAVHDANTGAELVTGALAFDNFNPSSCPPGYSCDGGRFNYRFPSKLFSYMAENPLTGGDKYMDEVLFNYYDVYGWYWEAQTKGKGVQAKANVLRAKMRDAGIPVVDLFVAETGEPSTADWVKLDGQARCLTITMVRGAATKLKGIIWWTFKDYPDSAPAPQNTWKYGLVDQNLTPKLSYAAMKTLTSELNGYTYNKTYSNKAAFKNVEAYRFSNGAARKYVVWSSSIKGGPSEISECGRPRTKNLAVFKAKTIRVVDYASGAAKTIKDNAKADKDKTVGKIGINISTSPKFVQINP